MRCVPTTGVASPSRNTAVPATNTADTVVVVAIDHPVQAAVLLDGFLGVGVEGLVEVVRVDDRDVGAVADPEMARVEPVPVGEFPGEPVHRRLDGHERAFRPAARPGRAAAGAAPCCRTPCCAGAHPRRRTPSGLRARARAASAPRGGDWRSWCASAAPCRTRAPDRGTHRRGAAPARRRPDRTICRRSRSRGTRRCRRRRSRAATLAGRVCVRSPCGTGAGRPRRASARCARPRRAGAARPRRRRTPRR